MNKFEKLHALQSIANDLREEILNDQNFGYEMLLAIGEDTLAILKYKKDKDISLKEAREHIERIKKEYYHE